jgi:hypothetical protein
VPLLTVVMGSGALVAISPMVAGLEQAGGDIPIKTAVSILVASIIYLTLMVLVFKVAGTLTKSWRLSRGVGMLPSGASAFMGGGHHERPLNPAPAPANAATAVSSDRVRSTVASIETSAANHRLAPPVSARLAIPAPAPVPSLTGPHDARGQLRYLHHRVAGVSNTVSREILR